MKQSYLLGAVLVLTSLTLASCANSGQKTGQSSSSTSSSAQVKKKSSNSSSKKSKSKDNQKQNVLVLLSLVISIFQVNGLNFLMQRLRDLFNIQMALLIISLP